jgi:hypothetical protein
MDLDSHDSTEHGTAPGGHLPGEETVGGHPHLHGRPASWLLVTVIIAAFIAGAFAVVQDAWPLFWVCLAIVVLSVPAGKLVGIMGDTVTVGDPAQQTGQGGHVASTGDFGSAVHPGVDVGPTPALSTGESSAIQS